MPDFQYQPPTGPLSGSEFERQTTRFFQQVQGAADAAQSAYVLCGDGEWRDIATLVAAAQARLAESVKAEEGTS